MPDSPYFIMWGIQTGYVLYQTLILLIFNSVTALHILDCIYTATICVLVYFIGQKSFSKENIIPSFFYTIYIFAAAYAGVLSNQHLFSLICLLAIYLLFTEKEKLKYWKYPLCGLLLAIANIIRPEGIILILAILGYEFFQIATKTDVKNFLKNVLSILLVYILILQATNAIVKNVGLNPSGINSTNMLWKFVCGFDIESNGSYSLRAEGIVFDSEKELEFIKENLASLTPKKLAILMRNKIITFWAMEDYNWVNKNIVENEYNILGKKISGNKIVSLANTIDKTFYITMFAFALVSIYETIIKKVKNNKKNLLVIALDIIAIIYLFIEVQPRYAYFAKILIFILATDGMNIVSNTQKLLKEGSKV